ncbi:hypothetical protein QE152_g12863 [Popillia japonica]|uniref:CCR4-NOT transcription complex subunit 10 n=1 Tax=Popillia japonica TaxID=7064 RepID=A0AAW1LH56_POPJA
MWSPRRAVLRQERFSLLTSSKSSIRKNIEYLFLQANQEYFLGNFQESVKILTSIPVDALKYNDCGESSTVMFYNNMGVLHHAMGKPNLACHYYQKALQEDTSLSSQKDENSLCVNGGSRYQEIMYNLGISLLYAGKPQQAFECLIVAVRRYHRNSRLWLRLAECCITSHRGSNEIDFDIKQKKKEFTRNTIIECIGSNENQKIILTTNLSKDKKYSTESQSYAVPVPTLEFAILCLRNAQLLLPSNSVSSPVPLLVKPGITPPAPPPSPGPAPSNSIHSEDVTNLRNSILIANAYVSLCLGDYIMTLEYSEKLLNQARKSGIHILLAHLYAAESLVLLDKVQEALQHLHPEHIKDLSHELPSDSANVDDASLKTNPPFKWFPSNRASIVALFQYNLAVVMTIRGQLDQAATLARQIWQSSQTTQVPAHILMLVLYIELKLGHVDVARSLIKQYSLQYRFRGDRAIVAERATKYSNPMKTLNSERQFLKRNGGSLRFCALVSARKNVNKTLPVYYIQLCEGGPIYILNRNRATRMC